MRGELGSTPRGIGLDEAGERDRLVSADVLEPVERGSVGAKDFTGGHDPVRIGRPRQSPQRGKRGRQRLRGKGRIDPPHLQPPLDQEERQRGGCRVPGAGSPQESGERDEEKRRGLVGEGNRDEARRQGSIPKHGRREQEKHGEQEGRDDRRDPEVPRRRIERLDPVGAESRQPGEAERSEEDEPVVESERKARQARGHVQEKRSARSVTDPREEEPEKERAAAQARLGPAEQPDSREREEHRSGVAERHARPVLPLLLHRTAAVDSVCERQDRRPETANRLSRGDGLAHPSPRDRRASGRILGGVRHGLEQRNEERRREKEGQQSGRSGGGESP